MNQATNEVLEEVTANVTQELNKAEKLIDATFKDGLWAFIITSVIILLLSAGVTRLVVKVLKKYHVNVFAIRIIKILLYTFATLAIAMQIIPLQQFALSVLAGGSVLVVVLGFAGQEAMSNVVSGMFIAVFKPFTTGDFIKIPSQGITGTVEDISLRHTVIKTVENSRTIIPNSVMNSSTIENVNFSDLRHCGFLDIGISYTADIDHAKRIMTDEITKHASYLDVRTEEERFAGAPAVVIRCTNLGDFSVDLRAVIWTKDFGTNVAMLSDLRQSIKKRFDAEGIEIPYPYRTVVLKKDE